MRPSLALNLVEAPRMAGEFAESDFNGDFRVGLQTGDNPFIQSAFGDMVTEETKQAIEDAKQSFVDGGSPFAGPVNDQDGNEVAAGELHRRVVDPSRFMARFTERPGPSGS